MTQVEPRAPLGALAARLPLWPTLFAVSAVVLLVQLAGTHATAWHFFEDAADLLVGRGPAGEGSGLHLYRDHPEFQFGPISIALALPLTLLGTDVGPLAAMVAGSLAGLLTVRLLLDTLDAAWPGLRRVLGPGVILAAGSVVVVTWGDVAVRTAHLDDALALTATVAGLRWCARGNPAATTMALGLAAAAKPWAIVFVPIAAAVPGDFRWLRPLAAAVIAGATWLPFLLAEPATFDTADFTITNDPTSVLRALGISDPTTPDWVRPAQLAGGTLLAAALVATRRWPAVVLTGVAWRLLLDPGAHRYYTVGLVLGALLVEIGTRPHRIPWATIAAAVALEATALPGVPAGPGRTLRLVVVVAALVVAWRADLRTGPDREPAASDRSSHQREHP